MAPPIVELVPPAPLAACKSGVPLRKIAADVLAPLTGTLIVRLSPGVTAMLLAHRKSPPRPDPLDLVPPAPTQTALIDVTPAGTTNVSSPVNNC